MKVGTRLRASERVVVHVDSPAVRWISALAVLSLSGWLFLLYKDYGWSLAILTAVVLIARGIFLGRPVTAGHAVAAMGVCIVGVVTAFLSFDLLGNLLLVASAMLLMWPTSARPNPADLPRVFRLVDATAGDPLAPFAMQPSKCFHFSADGTAAIAYRTRLGFAVVSGDPIGDEARFEALVADFAALCHMRGWRIVVLGRSQRRVGLWSTAAVFGRKFTPVPIGRDVVIEVATFEMAGRKYRNLRQAVQRTRNCGLTTEVVDEQRLSDTVRAELTEVILASPSGSRTERGFSMSLDGTLEGRYPGITLIVARDGAGRVQGFHRYATVGGGTEVTLDVPWRRCGAPNGIDERLSVDMVVKAREQGAQRLSLAFAAFPEIFTDKHRNLARSLVFTAVHLGDPLISLESLYRYLRKFHAVGDRRYVMATLTQVVPLLIVLLSLEFMPRRRHLVRTSVGAS
ncbi:bifunctional lysylphosphatidylglycerol flippase/synthetase MprF [Mycobacterium sp. ITM-2016-00318]|uniref:bifunctional lysylphosphatidylglycerol flippase/synthetase MprF n=1 Tax=Mycobacterium sp. ITM-2016-00318 TaxID=2099693 RepID=UPI000CF98321|nr:phosphatidylglycerol lysyltransferase domain-containing protein [Mycobacterium sp. ITM-2016-00318]WNG95269.1 phosphatidylglycerol lysyltransferase domain-containing protein [Mycobacterium sp. ITM-2016-00318]